jgi:hypothetical protein
LVVSKKSNQRNFCFLELRRFFTVVGGALLFLVCLLGLLESKADDWDKILKDFVNKILKEGKSCFQNEIHDIILL